MLCYDLHALKRRGGESVPQDRVYRSMLLDFYGELLTPRQRECCDLYYNEDLSLSEIAEACGISRQGAWDHIRRATAAMEETEDKTGLIRRQMETTERLKRLKEKLELLAERCASDAELTALVREAEAELRGLLKTED